jgi:hypothetical protein
LGIGGQPRTWEFKPADARSDEKPVSPRPALLLALLCLAFPAAAMADPEPPAGQTPAPDSGQPYPSFGQTLDPTVGQTPAALPDPGPRLKVKVRSNGRAAVIRPGVPRVIRQIVNAANRIALRPYRYGGGHGSFFDTAYDCSGSVAYALHAAGLVDATLDSTMFMHWGAKGRGRWITVYANHGHAWMMIAGLRYDTGAMGYSGGSRWSAIPRSTRGFVARHPAGF